MQGLLACFDKLPFSGVDMLMKAVGKDCTSLFSILFWIFFSGWILEVVTENIFLHPIINICRLACERSKSVFGVVVAMPKKAVFLVGKASKGCF